MLICWQGAESAQMCRQAGTCSISEAWNSRRAFPDAAEHGFRCSSPGPLGDRDTLEDVMVTCIPGMAV